MHVPRVMTLGMSRMALLLAFTGLIGSSLIFFGTAWWHYALAIVSALFMVLSVLTSNVIGHIYTRRVLSGLLKQEGVFDLSADVETGKIYEAVTCLKEHGHYRRFERFSEDDERIVRAILMNHESRQAYEVLTRDDVYKLTELARADLVAQIQPVIDQSNWEHAQRQINHQAYRTTGKDPRRGRLEA